MLFAKNFLYRAELEQAIRTIACAGDNTKTDFERDDGGVCTRTSTYYQHHMRNLEFSFEDDIE